LSRALSPSCKRTYIVGNMPSLNQPPWIRLFADGSASSGFDVRDFLSLRRHGEDFLFLPTKRSLSLRGLHLYQPQTRTARLGLYAVRSCLAAGFTRFLKKVEAPIGRQSALRQFVTGLSGGEQLPEFAVMAGNPRTEGRRFVLLAFDARGHEALVVKAACEPAGRELIGHEIRFLEAHGGKVPHVPSLRGTLRASPVAAMALPYQPGRCPRPDDMATVGTVLDSWFLDNADMAFSSFPQWIRLMEKGCGLPETFRSTLEAVRIKPVISHGDFTPWNLRGDNNGCLTALDWERGEAPGIPGWDWFHYVVQTSILVHREKPPEIYQRILRLLETPAFVAYARRAGFGSNALLIFASYLAFAAHATQSEGLEALLALKDYAYAQKLL